MTNTHQADIRDAVRERYASAAREAARGAYDEARRLDAGAGPGGTGCGPTDAEEQVFGVALYGEEARDSRGRRLRRRSAAASPPRWRTYARGRRCSISARAPAPTS
jgi:hypothetical protein